MHAHLFIMALIAGCMFVELFPGSAAKGSPSSKILSPRNWRVHSGTSPGSRRYTALSPHSPAGDRRYSVRSPHHRKMSGGDKRKSGKSPRGNSLAYSPAHSVAENGGIGSMEQMYMQSMHSPHRKMSGDEKKESDKNPRGNSATLSDAENISVRMRTIGSVERMYVMGQWKDKVLAEFEKMENSVVRELANALGLAQYLVGNADTMELLDELKMLEELKIKLEELQVDVPGLQYHVSKVSRVRPAAHLLQDIHDCLVQALERCQHIKKHVKGVADKGGNIKGDADKGGNIKGDADKGGNIKGDADIDGMRRQVVQFLQEAISKFGDYMQRMGDTSAESKESADNVDKHAKPFRNSLPPTPKEGNRKSGRDQSANRNGAEPKTIPVEEADESENEEGAESNTKSQQSLLRRYKWAEQQQENEQPINMKREWAEHVRRKWAESQLRKLSADPSLQKLMRNKSDLTDYEA